MSTWSEMADRLDELEQRLARFEATFAERRAATRDECWTASVVSLEPVEQRLATLVNQVRSLSLQATRTASFEDNETRALFELAQALMQAAIEAES